jgi:hypothetical protein
MSIWLFLGPDMAAAFLSAGLVAAFGFAVYAFTCAVLWLGLKLAAMLRQRGEAGDLPQKQGHSLAGGAHRGPI